jgi:hypothetical protein
MLLLIADRGLIVQGGVAAVRVVPALDELEHVNRPGFPGALVT